MNRQNGHSLLGRESSARSGAHAEARGRLRSVVFVQRAPRHEPVVAGSPLRCEFNVNDRFDSPPLLDCLDLTAANGESGGSRVDHEGTSLRERARRFSLSRWLSLRMLITGRAMKQTIEKDSGGGRAGALGAYLLGKVAWHAMGGTHGWPFQDPGETSAVYHSLKGSTYADLYKDACQ